MKAICLWSFVDSIVEHASLLLWVSELMDNLEELRHPIGRYNPPTEITKEQRTEWIQTLAALPAELRKSVDGLLDAELDTPYRPDGWTIRQVVHHLADSHLNSYVRFRLALTEDAPTIKAYDEKKWAELSDAHSGPVAPSFQLLESLHTRLVALLNSLSDADFAKTFAHPKLGSVRLDWNLGLYAWHCHHHLAHITGVRRRENF